MRFAFLALSLLLPGCATIVEGTSQSVTVATNPPGARCDLDRTGSHIGTVMPTPGSVRLDKSKNDLSVSCQKEGYQTVQVTQSPKFGIATVGNVLIGGLVGVVIDAASGANFSYSDVRVDLPPLVPVSPPVATIMPNVTPARYVGS